MSVNQIQQKMDEFYKPIRLSVAKGELSVPLAKRMLREKVFDLMAECLVENKMLLVPDESEVKVEEV